jgi:hypothetical protein
MKVLDIVRKKMSNDDKKFFGLCIVVEDKVEDKFEIKVLPVSYVPDMRSEINKNTNGMLNLVDSSNFHSAIASTSSDHIEATWLPNGEQNRISAPDVCKGDIVEVYKVHGVDEYYWQVFAHNQGLRKKEKVLIWFSNKSTIGPNREADSYYLLVDTINKIVHFHKVNNLEFYQEKTNGEFTRVILTRAFILDLAEQIKEIESNIFESEYYPSKFTVCFFLIKF